MPRSRTVTSPYPRTLAYFPDADNGDLVALVVFATVESWPLLHVDVPREDAARAVYDLCRAHVQYVLEDGDQLPRMPWRTLADGVGDCKSLAVLCASVCRSAGCDTLLRFVRYPGDEHFGHVYTVADGVCVDPEIGFGRSVRAESWLDVPV